MKWRFKFFSYMDNGVDVPLITGGASSVLSWLASNFSMNYADDWHVMDGADAFTEDQKTIKFDHAPTTADEHKLVNDDVQADFELANLLVAQLVTDSYAVVQTLFFDILDKRRRPMFTETTAGADGAYLYYYMYEYTIQRNVWLTDFCAHGTFPTLTGATVAGGHAFRLAGADANKRRTSRVDAVMQIPAVAEKTEYSVVGFDNVATTGGDVVLIAVVNIERTSGDDVHILPEKTTNIRLLVHREIGGARIGGYLHSVRFLTGIKYVALSGGSTFETTCDAKLVRVYAVPYDLVDGLISTESNTYITCKSEHLTDYDENFQWAIASFDTKSGTKSKRVRVQGASDATAIFSPEQVITVGTKRTRAEIRGATGQKPTMYVNTSYNATAAALSIAMTISGKTYDITSDFEITQVLEGETQSIIAQKETAREVANVRAYTGLATAGVAIVGGLATLATGGAAAPAVVAIAGGIAGVAGSAGTINQNENAGHSLQTQGEADGLLNVMKNGNLFYEIFPAENAADIIADLNAYGVKCGDVLDINIANMFTGVPATVNYISLVVDNISAFYVDGVFSERAQSRAAVAWLREHLAAGMRFWRSSNISFAQDYVHDSTPNWWRTV